MKYLEKKFSTPANTTAFRDNWDAVFSEDKKATKCPECGHDESKHDFTEAWDNCSVKDCNCGNNVGR